MNIVVIGLGKVGKNLVKNLVEDGHEVIAIDNNSDLVDEVINSYDVMGVTGNGASYEIQAEANVKDADLVIATTSSDEINILSCILAKKFGTKHTIARIRNQEYEKQLRFLRDVLGLSMAINPEKAVAKEISGILRFPNAMNIESFSKKRIELIEYRISENNPIIGMKLSELYGTIKARVLICAVSRKEDIYIPSGDFSLQQNDIIYLTSSPKEIETFFRQLGLYKGKAKNVIIIGASMMGFYLARDLLDTGMNVKIIDNDEERCKKMSMDLPKAHVIVGNANDSDLLEEEGIHDSDAFVALTGMDETNIILALYAIKQRVEKVVAKINIKTYSDIAVSSGLVDSVVSTGSVTADIILQYVRAMQNAEGTSMKSLHRIAQGKVNALEFSITERNQMIGIPLKDMNIKKNILVAGIVRRNGQTIVPTGSDCFQPGDDVVVISTDNNILEIEDILK